MDKYEYKLKLDQMKTLASEGDYATAAEIADSVNWRKVRNVNSLCKVAEVYENVGKLEESRDMLLLAYDRSPIGRMIIYRLALLAIRMKSLDEAEEYYHEFVEIAPHDTLKYILKYKIHKERGEGMDVLIADLEELKEQEYTEEWAYELASLYHKAGMQEKCVEACDELILWFGEGKFVERALDLKLQYQSLTRQQEDKYREIRQRRDGVTEVKPEDHLESGEILHESVKIPQITTNAARFNTVNLQEELAKSMQQIMDATENDTVSDTMENIKRLVGEHPSYIPESAYESAPEYEKPQYEEPEYEEPQHQEPEYGESEYQEPEYEEPQYEEPEYEEPQHQEPEYEEPQQSGYEQSGYREAEESLEIKHTPYESINEVLAEWEKTKRAAEETLRAADQKRLAAAKAKALQEAGDIMDRLVDVIPKLEAGFTAKEAFESGEMSSEEAGKLVADVNVMLQQEIDKLSQDQGEISEKEIEVKDNMKQTEQPLKEPTKRMPDLGAILKKNKESIKHGSLLKGILPETKPEEDDYFDEEEEAEELEETEEMKTAEADTVREAEEMEVEIEPEVDAQETLTKAIMEAGMEEVDPLEAVMMETSDEIDQAGDFVAKALEAENQQEIREYESQTEQIMTKLPDEVKGIFSYFVPVTGMENQLCRVLAGSLEHVGKSNDSASGNILIQGIHGSGKTVLAADIIKALQKLTGNTTGRVGKIDASTLNQKDIPSVLKKVAGGYLIIERAGELSRETATRLSLIMEGETNGLVIIMEDTKAGINKALGRDSSFAQKFTEKVDIPYFTSDELVAFGRAYAKDMGYRIDEMGILALYNRISNIQKLDQATTLTEIKEIVDDAIAQSEKGGFKKILGMIASRRNTADDYIILREKDFGE